MRTFVIGDIHGAYKALIQCLKRADFNYQEDRLIALGDVCDGYPEVKDCIDELLKIKNLDYIMGNHDLWALAWVKFGRAEEVWLTQGGANTIKSYGHLPVPPQHIQFLENARPWIERDKMLFIHGGFEPELALKEQLLETFVWDRTLLRKAYQKHLNAPDFKFGTYNDIFIGHTPTLNYQTLTPLHLCNIWALDTGAGWSGKLTIMDVSTKKYWQSDLTPALYPGISSR